MTPRRNKKRSRGLTLGSRNRGFTLVELLLALTLMSMLLALAYGGLRASTRATENGKIILEDSGRVRMAHQFVHQRLNQMLPLAWYESEDKTERPMFLGSASRIRYVAPMPGYLGFGGPQVQELAFIDGEKGQDLVLYNALLQGFEEDDLYVNPPQLLIDNIRLAGFSFIGRDEVGELMFMGDEWLDPNIMPEAVIVDVEFNEDVFIHWPLLSAAPRINSRSITLALKNVQIGNANAPGVRPVSAKKPITRGSTQ